MKCSSLVVKHCRICGDKASGFHYDGLCCEACKIFFLRNESNNKLFCLRMGKCEINILTRKCCAKCRLDKCLATGMFLKSNKDDNKAAIESKSILDQHMHDILLSIDFDCPSPVDLNLPQLPFVVARKPKDTDTELIAPERQVIANVQYVLGATFVDESNLQMVGSIAKLSDGMKLFTIYIQKIVKFSKSIPAFKQLCPNDQLIILKSVYYEILMTRFIYMYDLVNDGFPIIENESESRALLVKLDTSLQIKNPDLIPLGIKFQVELYEKMENDFTIRDLLIAILLFKPRANLSNPEHVHYQYSLYCRLLRCYLEHKYKNVQKANQKYKSLIRLSDGFDDQTKMVRTVVMAELDVQQLPQILMEIFDL